MSKTEIPSIRFRGFDDAWEQRKFGEIASKYEDPVPTPHDGYYRLGIRSHAKGTFHSYVAKGQELETAQMHRVAAGNFIVNITFGWEHAVAITDENDAGKLVSHRFPQFSFAEGMVPEFFRYVIVDEKFRHHLWLASPGGAGRNRVLKLDDMLNYLMRFPSRDEQIKIAEFFRQLDHLITLHQRKFEKLTNVKKSMLEKMFPQNGSCYPAVRFKGFTGPWERRKFGDVFEEYSEKNRADLPPLTIIQGSGTIRRDESERALQYDKASLSNYKVVNEGDLIVHLRSFEGGLEKANSQGIISPAYHTFHGEGVDSRFYYTYFRSKNFIDTDLKPHVYGIRDGRSIDVEGMKTIEIPFTSYPEQKLIGDAIDSINTLISLQRRELEKLQSIKKSLLEKMFV